ncbi:LytR C-terminal domain-containing protein [Streptomyces qinzhouensis]|uniref:LytR family transcriptional regulator n=1 Tax=Streptomyces qinzhouensis TaxID=2599401 RepID=A0A5B8J8R6_9ACTN|nr:LytR C-terminal domain-containing protein [Streptomyces qinzhouensis]QDY77727.1 LytR family transcriptional regulator [Streptomyces qinzhouensis]
MSMLTPPGMGGKYRITGDKYPRMRRPPYRRRIITVAIAAVVTLGLAGWGTVQLIDAFDGDSEKETTASRKPGCVPAKKGGPSAPPPRPPLGLKPAQVTVNVYNATPRGGLAKAAAEELKARGFTIGKVGNATADYDKKIPGTGLLLGAPGATKGTFSVLGTQLPGAPAKTDTRTTADVDLILGTTFTTLAPRPAADKALTILANPIRPPAC